MKKITFLKNNLFKKIISYFRTIEIYESKYNLSFNLSNFYKFETFKNFTDVKSKNILRYFYKNKKKIKRFNTNCIFLTLSYRKKLVSSGWLFIGKKWNISEIDKEINVSKKYVIFDFITQIEHRNKGYYTKLLKLIRNKFKNKNILIYVLSSNKKSKKAIINAGFTLKKKY